MNNSLIKGIICQRASRAIYFILFLKRAEQSEVSLKRAEQSEVSHQGAPKAQNVCPSVTSVTSVNRYIKGGN